MDTRPSLESHWNALLKTHAFSIGQFVVTNHEDNVRVYHMRTEEVCHCPPHESFREIQRLCRERGYDFRDLLNRFEPKTFQPGTWKYPMGGAQGDRASHRSSPFLQPLQRDPLQVVHQKNP